MHTVLTTAPIVTALTTDDMQNIASTDKILSTAYIGIVMTIASKDNLLHIKIHRFSNYDAQKCHRLYSNSTYTVLTAASTITRALERV